MTVLVQDKIEVLNEKLEKDTYDKPDCPDFESNFSKVLGKKRKFPLTCGYFESLLLILISDSKQ